MKIFRIAVTYLFIILLFSAFFACSSTSTPGGSTTPAVYSRYELAYKLLDDFTDYFWCDPDFYPIAREGQEQANALEQFASIQTNSAEFTAILQQIGLSEKAIYSDQEKLTIYREHKKLTRALTLTPEGDLFSFTIRTGEGEGKTIEGTISTNAKIKVLKETKSFNTCPICLTRGTLISSPYNDIPVEKIHSGIQVYSINHSGLRIAVPVLKVSRTQVPTDFPIVKITLQDNRRITASLGHPSAERRQLGDFKVGELLDGSPISEITYPMYDGEATFDLLPGGQSGLYYANGILLGSTLFPD